MKLHIVKDGDTLNSLSQKYGVNAEQIIAVNAQIADFNRLESGAKVKIPTEPATAQVVVKPPVEEPVKETVTIEEAVEETAAQPVMEQNVEAAEHYVPAQPNLPNLQPFMNESPELQEPAQTNTGPTVLKTKPEATAASPMYVKWTGMDEDSVHPYANIPTPAYPAGAFTPPVYPGISSSSDMGMLGMPNTAQPFMPPMSTMPSMPSMSTMPPMPTMTSMPPMTSHSFPPQTSPFAAAPFGIHPYEYGMDVVPFGAPFPPGPPMTLPANPGVKDCGCSRGSESRQGRLPYALSSAEMATAAPELKLGEADSRGERAETAEVNQQAHARKPQRKTKKLSRSAHVKMYLQRRRPKKKAVRRSSSPWIKD